MRPGQSYCEAILDTDTPGPGRLWKALRALAVTALPDGGLVARVPFVCCEPGTAWAAPDAPRRLVDVEFRAIGDGMLRMTAAFGGRRPDPADPMLEPSSEAGVQPLRLESLEHAWRGIDAAGRVRVTIPRPEPSPPPAGAGPAAGMTYAEAPEPHFEAVLQPDGHVEVPLMAVDTFYPRLRESVPLGWLERTEGTGSGLVAFHAAHDECFAGTGERFSRLNLAGGTYVLENADACGVNSRRAYKNVPLYVSSRGYGVLLLTSAHVRLSLADVSTRASIARVDDDLLDVVVLGGPPAVVARRYQSLTGFPRPVPRWSYGIWMSRMTYHSAAEVEGIADRLRREAYPCDVLHLDTGWFAEDFVCDWEFGLQRFPDPPAFFERLRARGFRCTLWQLPTVYSDVSFYREALERGFLVERVSGRDESNFGAVGVTTPYASGAIDFTNPDAVAWYEGLLERLLRQGAAAIKADFGEYLDPASDYPRLPYARLHNLYPLQYQQSVFEATRRVHGEAVIWARGGWTGCQRYPVHWGGDAAGTWDGLAASLRGGLHLGLSGFAFWSHDIPGFHGLPDFMRSRADDELCVRWTQLGTFSSHMRYHGTTPREPWEFPEVAPLLRAWWQLRYALIPYLERAGKAATRSGLPVLRALVFHHPGDRTCWHVDDQFYCGDDLLVAPVLRPGGRRDIYLPDGDWMDFWSGRAVAGGRWLHDIATPLALAPLYVRRGARVPVYPEPVQCTDEMREERIVTIAFDDSYRGFADTPLAGVVGLPPAVLDSAAGEAR